MLVISKIEGYLVMFEEISLYVVEKCGAKYPRLPL